MIFAHRCFSLSLLTLLLCLFGASAVHANSAYKGQFLVASDQLVDPRFHGRVILVIQHNDQGSAGLIVNRPSRLSLDKLLPQDSTLARLGMSLFYGGPVEPKTLLALVAVRNHPPEPADQIIDNLYLTGVGVLDEWPEFTEEVLDCRVFVGYTGWAIGQLEIEIARGDWQVLPADKENIFSKEGEMLRERLRKLR